MLWGLLRCISSSVNKVTTAPLSVARHHHDDYDNDDDDDDDDDDDGRKL